VTDLAVLGQDPRFPGGSRVMAEAFWDASTALGRKPVLHWLAYRGLDGRAVPASLDEGLRVAALAPGLDGLNQLVAGRRFARDIRDARSIWAVTTVASHGYGAALTGRPYGVWASASLHAEWAARRPALSVSRRAALAASSRTLRLLERRTLRRAARVYATSPSSRDELAEASGLDAASIGVLPIPVDLVRFAPLPDGEWRAGLEQPTLVFVGRADDPRKNIALLLDAFAAVRRDVPGAQLVLVGPGADSIDRLGVRSAGEVPDVAAVLRSATILVLPSRQEGFGIVVAEALACGVPVVSTPSGGPEDLIRSSRGGIVLESFDADELAATVTELLGDEVKLGAMRVAGRTYVKSEHAPDRLRTLLERAFRDVDGHG
jgi:glycosyltransferase involved in cell wall biosynthesis